MQSENDKKKPHTESALSASDSIDLSVVSRRNLGMLFGKMTQEQDDEFSIVFGGSKGGRNSPSDELFSTPRGSERSTSPVTVTSIGSSLFSDEESDDENLDNDNPLVVDETKSDVDFNTLVEFANTHVFENLQIIIRGTVLDKKSWELDRGTNKSKYDVNAQSIKDEMEKAAVALHTDLNNLLEQTVKFNGEKYPLKEIPALLKARVTDIEKRGVKGSNDGIIEQYKLVINTVELMKKLSQKDPRNAREWLYDGMIETRNCIVNVCATVGAMGLAVGGALFLGLYKLATYLTAAFAFMFAAAVDTVRFAWNQGAVPVGHYIKTAFNNGLEDLSEAKHQKEFLDADKRESKESGKTKDYLAKFDRAIDKRALNEDEMSILKNAAKSTLMHDSKWDETVASRYVKLNIFTGEEIDIFKKEHEDDGMHFYSSDILKTLKDNRSTLEAIMNVPEINKGDYQKCHLTWLQLNNDIKTATKYLRGVAEADYAIAIKKEEKPTRVIEATAGFFKDMGVDYRGVYDAAKEGVKGIKNTAAERPGEVTKDSSLERKGPSLGFGSDDDSL